MKVILNLGATNVASPPSNALEARGRAAAVAAAAAAAAAAAVYESESAIQLRRERRRGIVVVGRLAAEEAVVVDKVSLKQGQDVAHVDLGVEASAACGGGVC